ncbi:MAG: hypothetical protein KDC18_16300 [Alphaproteobacteria bacterium]|nr:hypothetical protein [Alphaproteobacteria bacterium]
MTPELPKPHQNKSNAEIEWMAHNAPHLNVTDTRGSRFCIEKHDEAAARARDVQAYSFETRRRGKLRTTGVVVQRPLAHVLERLATEHAAYARVALSRSDGAARGKLAFFDDNELSVLQVGPRGELTPAFCGNATAAVALAHGRPNGRMRLADPGGGQVSVDYRRDGNNVAQDWLIPSMSVEDFMWRGRRVFRVNGLNVYNIVVGGLPVGVAAETCRVQLAAGHPNAKLAVLGDGPERCRVAFYNASGRHGAAPMTGLASLAVLASSSSAFAAHLGERAVTYQTAAGQEKFDLPEIGTAEDGRLRVAMPDVDAFLSPLGEVS